MCTLRSRGAITCTCRNCFAHATSAEQPYLQLPSAPPCLAQATAFALNMGLAWFGFAAGGYNGSALLGALGGVEPPDFVNLRLFVVLRSLARLLPLGFIPLLVPTGSPQDDAFDIGQADDEGDQVGLGMQQQPSRRRGGKGGEAEEGGSANGGGSGGGTDSALPLPGRRGAADGATTGVGSGCVVQLEPVEGWPQTAR